MPNLSMPEIHDVAFLTEGFPKLSRSPIQRPSGITMPSAVAVLRFNTAADCCAASFQFGLCRLRVSNHDLTFWALMTASAGSGHTVVCSYVRTGLLYCNKYFRSR